jgi:hypothetical protein
MSADGLVCAVRFDFVRRSASLARIHATLKHEHVRLLGKIDLVHVDLPGASKALCAAAGIGINRAANATRKNSFFMANLRRL